MGEVAKVQYPFELNSLLISEQKTTWNVLNKRKDFCMKFPREALLEIQSKSMVSESNSKLTHKTTESY